MDASILTTIFCLILLVLTVLALNELLVLKQKINAHLDRTDLHTEKLKTIMSILQNLEAKVHLMFNNAPPSPGETTIPTLYTPTDWSKCKWQNAPGEPQPDLDNSDMDLAKDKFGHEPLPGHYSYVQGKVIPEKPKKKKGRPKKAPKA